MLCQGLELYRSMLSITALEFEEGVNKDPKSSQRCLWFHRTLPNLIDKVKPSIIGQFTDVVPVDAIVLPAEGASAAGLQRIPTDPSLCLEEAAVLGKQRLISLMHASLPAECKFHYNVQACEQGVDPQECGGHAEYLRAFCEDFTTAIMGQIQTACKVTFCSQVFFKKEKKKSCAS